MVEPTPSPAQGQPSTSTSLVTGGQQKGQRGSRQKSNRKQQQQSQQPPKTERGTGPDDAPIANKGGRGSGRGRGGSQNNRKLRGLERDKPEVRLSKTLSWILRHGASSEGITMRGDGFVKVDDILKNSRVQPLGLTLDQLKGIVQADLKQRFSLVLERADGTSVGYAEVEGDGSSVKGAFWWIKANQGHSITTVKLEMKSILSIEDIPSKLAVHGTTKGAWEIIQKEGLSKMSRNHIHLAQGVGGDNVISGMRKTSEILIFVDVQKALDSGIKFQLSDNGVVLTEGDKTGYLKPEFIGRVEDAKTRQALEGWGGSGSIDNKAVATEPMD